MHTNSKRPFKHIFKQIMCGVYLYYYFGCFQCPDKPNVTNNIVCSSCGGAGHIAKDCRQKRPGAGPMPQPNRQDKAKIDEEVSNFTTVRLEYL